MCTTCAHPSISHLSEIKSVQQNKKKLAEAAKLAGGRATLEPTRVNADTCVSG